MIPQAQKVFQYGAAVRLIVQFIDPVLTAENNNVPVPLDIAGATNLLIGLLFPDTTTAINYDGAFVTDGSDGEVYYDTVYNTDLVQLGLFQIQGKATLGSSVVLTEKGYFQVVTNVDNED